MRDEDIDSFSFHSLSEVDPFQNGDHNTWPTFAVEGEIARFERREQDLRYSGLTGPWADCTHTIAESLAAYQISLTDGRAVVFVFDDTGAEARLYDAPTLAHAQAEFDPFAWSVQS